MAKNLRAKIALQEKEIRRWKDAAAAMAIGNIRWSAWQSETAFQPGWPKYESRCGLLPDQITVVLHTRYQTQNQSGSNGIPAPDGTWHAMRFADFVDTGHALRRHFPDILEGTMTDALVGLDEENSK